MTNTAMTTQEKRGLSTMLWSPKTYAELKQFAEDISKSSMVPAAYKDKPGDIVVAMARGSEVGFTPLASLDAFAIINGKACLYGDAPLALVQASGLMEWHKEYNDGQTWTFEAKRRGDPAIITSTFTVDEAKKAGLWGKAGPWTNYAPRMMKFRARGYGLRDKWADVLKGLSIAEEVADYEVVQTIDNKTAIVEPRRASAAAEPTMVHEKPAAIVEANMAGAETTGEADLSVFVQAKPPTKTKEGQIRIWLTDTEYIYTDHDGYGAIAKAAASKNQPIEVSWIKTEQGKKANNVTLAD